MPPPPKKKKKRNRTKYTLVLGFRSLQLVINSLELSRILEFSFCANNLQKNIDSAACQTRTEKQCDKCQKILGGGGCGSSEQCIMHQQALPLLHFLSLKMKKKYTVRNTLKMYYVSAGTATTPLSRFEIGKESHCKYISGMFQKF